MVICRQDQKFNLSQLLSAVKRKEAGLQTGRYAVSAGHAAGKVNLRILRGSDSPPKFPSSKSRDTPSCKLPGRLFSNRPAKFRGNRFIVDSPQDHDGNLRSVGMNPSEGAASLPVRKRQVPQDGVHLAQREPGQPSPREINASHTRSIELPPASFSASCMYRVSAGFPLSTGRALVPYVMDVTSFLGATCLFLFLVKAVEMRPPFCSCGRPFFHT